MDDDFGSDPFDDDSDQLLEIAATQMEEQQQAHQQEQQSTPSQRHLHILKRYFGHASFKNLQWQVIDGVMDRKQDQIVVMATGYGKSLCYQFPPVYKDKCSIVVSPLIALMQDQVMGLKVAGISACFLSSAQNNRTEVYKGIQENKYRVIYITPEFVENGISILQTHIKAEDLLLFAIDEAHCVSQWGHDFRSSYRRLDVIRNNFPEVPIIALTATATENVVKDIELALKLKQPCVSKTSFNRDNLYIEVRYKGVNPWSDLASCMKVDPLTQARKFTGSTIIYCPTKKEVENIGQILREHGLNVALYHAGLSMPERNKSHHAFVHDSCDVIVCTVAFGMGINKSDVRQVIHYGAPRDMESYYQEMGRAGRDGLPSNVRVFYATGDFSTHRYHLQDILNEKWRQHRNSLIHNMEVYLGSKRECRRKQILSHFNEDLPEGRSQGCCDNCSQALVSKSDETKDERLDITKNSKLLLSSVADCGGYYGLTIPCEVLRGSKAKNIKPYLFERASFGKGKDKSKSYWMALGRALTSENYISQKSVQTGNRFSYSTVYLSEKGRRFLNGDGPESIVIVPTKDLRDEHVPRKSLMTPDVITATNSDASSSSSPEQLLRKELYDMLLDVRLTLANEAGIARYMLVNETVLKQMAEICPSKKESLSRLGLAEAKIQQFGDEFVKHIVSFCKEHDLSVDNFSPLNNAAYMQTAERVLNTTQLSTYTLFQELQDIDKVAAQRGLKTSTIITHLCDAIKHELPVNTDALHLTDAIRRKVEKVIASPELDSNVMRLAPIKDLCEERYPDEGIGWDQVKIVIALLTSQYSVNDNKVQWSRGEMLLARDWSESAPKAAKQDNTASTTTNDDTSDDEKDVSTGTKRSVPDWMQDEPMAKGLMKKKMRANSLFK